mmetsp:Transcript_27160/g.41101  ORF Transcript_27160/g.41101 Transcript_27160/m.41101 type:complete len:170 (-) Transcript_27160:167-676(-)
MNQTDQTEDIGTEEEVAGEVGIEVDSAATGGEVEEEDALEEEEGVDLMIMILVEGTISQKVTTTTIAMRLATMTNIVVQNEPEVSAERAEKINHATIEISAMLKTGRVGEAVFTTTQDGLAIAGVLQDSVEEVGDTEDEVDMVEVAIKKGRSSLSSAFLFRNELCCTVR